MTASGARRRRVDVSDRDGHDVTVRSDAFRTLLIFSFRYALGRRSAGVGYVADLLVEHAARLLATDREQIARDTEMAISGGDAGMDCDVQDWRRVVAAMRRGSS